MRIRQLLIPFLLLGALCAGSGRVLAQDDAAYGATVPVIDTSDAQRDHAITVALSMVLGEVAGRDLTRQPGYADVLAKAPTYVQQYQYARAPAGAPAPFMLTVSFDPSAVRRLVGDMGVATWSGPQVPVLLQVQDAGGANLGADAVAPLVQAASARGIRVIGAAAGTLPDRADLADADETALADVGRQYHTGLILLGTLDSGRAEWTLVTAGKTERWQGSGTDAQAMLAAAGNELVAHLMQRFASASGGGGEGEIWVSGVKSASDFVQLLGVLRGDSSVGAVDVREAEGDGVLLDVTTRVPLAAALDALGAGGRVLPVESTRAGADAGLRWLR